MIEEKDDYNEESDNDEVNDDDDDDSDESYNDDDDKNDESNNDATTNNLIMAGSSIDDHVAAGPSSNMIRLSIKLPLFLGKYVDIVFRCLPKAKDLVLETDEEVYPPKVQWLFNVLAIAARELETGTTKNALLTRKIEPFTKASMECFFKCHKSKQNVTFGGTVMYTDITKGLVHPNTTFGYILKALYTILNR